MSDYSQKFNLHKYSTSDTLKTYYMCIWGFFPVEERGLSATPSKVCDHQANT